MDAIHRQGLHPIEALKAHGVHPVSREELEAMEFVDEDEEPEDWDDEDEDEEEAESDGDEGGSCGSLVQDLANRMADRLGIERPNLSALTPKAESVALDEEEFFAALKDKKVALPQFQEATTSTGNLPEAPKSIGSTDDPQNDWENDRRFLEDYATIQFPYNTTPKTKSPEPLPSPQAPKPGCLYGIGQR